MDSAALILAVGLWPVMLLLGGFEVYRAMTQQKILALARVPRHEVTFYNTEDKDTSVIINRYERAGYSVDRESFKRNRLSGNFEFTMKLAV